MRTLARFTAWIIFAYACYLLFAAKVTIWSMTVPEAKAAAFFATAAWFYALSCHAEIRELKERLGKT